MRAEQPGPTGQALSSPGQWPRTRSGTGPVTPRVPEEGKLRANSRGLGPPIWVRDLPASVRTSHARRTNIPPGWGPGAPRVPQRAGAGASLPLEDSPTHRIQCGWLRRALPRRHAGQLLSGLTVDRILPRYSAAACAASAQSPSAALNGYDGTAPFHHTAYAASYTAVQLCGRLRQAAPQAMP